MTDLMRSDLRLMLPSHQRGELAASLLLRTGRLNCLTDASWQGQPAVVVRPSRDQRDLGIGLGPFFRHILTVRGDGKNLLGSSTAAAFFAAGHPFLFRIWSNQWLLGKPIVRNSDWPRPAEEGVRYCIDCAEEDQRTIGTPAARVVHQLPMSAVCWRHGTTLRKCVQLTSTCGSISQSTAAECRNPTSAMKLAKALSVVFADADGAIEWLRSWIGPRRTMRLSEAARSLSFAQSAGVEPVPINVCDQLRSAASTGSVLPLVVAGNAACVTAILMAASDHC